MAIKCLQLTCDAAIKKYLFLPGTVPAYKAGFIQFAYGTTAGPLQAINWKQSIFFPEYPGATGVYVWTPPGLGASAVTISQPGQGLSMETVVGVINLASALVTGFTEGSTSLEASSAIVRSAASSVPVPLALGGLGRVTLPISVGLGELEPFSNELNGYLLILGLASEIAQQSCYKNQAANEVVFPSLTGSAYTAPVSGVARYAKVRAVSVPAAAEYHFGASGILMLGHHCWEYNGFRSPLKYLNSQNVITYPEGVNVTGFQLMLKPNILVNLTLGINDYGVESLVTTLGEINLLTGVFTGFPTSVMNPPA